MANNKSAEKIKTNERNRLTNRFYKTSVRTLIKSLLKT
jgi:ribosomal protein S20